MIKFGQPLDKSDRAESYVSRASRQSAFAGAPGADRRDSGRFEGGEADPPYLFYDGWELMAEMRRHLKITPNV